MDFLKIFIHLINMFKILKKWQNDISQATVHYYVPILVIKIEQKFLTLPNRDL